MTNKPKAPQNNTGKHPASITATQAPGLSQTHNNSCSTAPYCHIFSNDAKPKTHTPLTHNLELTRDTRKAYRAFPTTACTRQPTAGQRHLWWTRCLVCVTVQLPRSGNTEAPKVAGAAEAPDPHWRPRGRHALQSPSGMRDRPSVHRERPLICSVVPLKPCILHKGGERETSSKHDRQDGGEMRLRCAAAVAFVWPWEGSGIIVEMIR